MATGVKLSAVTQQARQRWAHIPDALAVSALAVVGGYVDVVGFVSLFGLYTASITGNVASAAAVLGSGKASVGTTQRVLVVLTFVFASAVGSLLALCVRQRCGASHRRVAFVLLACEAAFLAAFWGAGIALEQGETAVDSSAVTGLAVLCTMAMGLQNSATLEAFPDFPATTALTKTLASCGAATVLSTTLSLRECGVSHEWVGHAPETHGRDAQVLAAQARGARASFVGVINPLASFTAGAVFGAYVYTAIGFHAVALPIAVIIALLVQLALPLPQERNSGSAGAVAGSTSGAEKGATCPLAAAASP